MNSDIKKVQCFILEIFKVFKKICDENGLRYFAIGGTCIGAVRHNGFIPWDDDLDVAMPDRDYERFLSIAPKALPAEMKLVLTSDHKHNASVFAKIHNINTTFIEESELKISI